MTLSDVWLVAVVELNPEPSNQESTTLTLSCITALCPLTLSDMWLLLLVVVVQGPCPAGYGPGGLHQEDDRGLRKP